MNEPAKVESKRDAMPETTAFVERKRKEWGKEHVNLCIRQAQKGNAGFFYAIEGGHVLGTPFAADSPMGKWQHHAVITGCKFAAFMATPEAVNGAH